MTTPVLPSPPPSPEDLAGRRYYLPIQYDGSGGYFIYFPAPQVPSLAETTTWSISRNTTSNSTAAEKPTAISTPHSTETKTEAGDSGQVAAQSKPAPPAAQTNNGKALRRDTLLHVATLLLMLVLSLSSIQSFTQTNSVPTIIPTILISCSQVLIIISLFL